jgi:hypothetical protein
MIIDLATVLSNSLSFIFPLFGIFVWSFSNAGIMMPLDIILRQLARFGAFSESVWPPKGCFQSGGMNLFNQ